MVSRKDLKKKLLINMLSHTNPSQNSQSNSRSSHPPSNTSANNKSKSISPEASTKATPHDSLAYDVKNESIHYNVIDDMKRDHANISNFELTKITIQQN